MKIGVLVSGRGSNLQAIIDSIKSGFLQVELAIVLSNKADAGALKHAREHNIPAISVDPKEYSSRDDYEQEVASKLSHYGVDLVVLAGYMLIVGKPLLEAFKGKIINIHPALIPQFPGLYAQKQALDAGVKETGCTVHFVDESLDAGPIILQEKVQVLDDDTLDSLSARILEKEHIILPKAIKLISEGKVKLINGKVSILD